MGNLIVIGILLVLVGAAVRYIWKERKKGTRCIGCPAAGCCGGKGCGSMEEMVSVRTRKVGIFESQVRVGEEGSKI